MENWRRTFLKRMELELQSYRIDSIFLPEEGQNPDTLRQMFDVGQEEPGVVIMDMTIFRMEDGRQLLQIFTEMVLDVDESPELLACMNELNLPVPLGAFGYFKQERQLYHKYNQLVKEPENLEVFVQQNLETVDLILGAVAACYQELYETAGRQRQRCE